MQPFIDLVTSVLGTSEATARQATAGLIGFLSKAAPAEVANLLSRMPGAQEFMRYVTPPAAASGAAAAPPPPSPGVGVVGALGDLMTNAAMAMQGAIGSGNALLTLMGHIGLDPQRASQFVALFLDFARKQAGSDLVDRVVASVPGLGLIFPPKT